MCSCVVLFAHCTFGQFVAMLIETIIARMLGIFIPFGFCVFFVFFCFFPFFFLVLMIFFAFLFGFVFAIDSCIVCCFAVCN